MKKELYYTPKGRVYFLHKDLYALGLRESFVLEYDKKQKLYIPRNLFGLKVTTLLIGYTYSQLVLLVFLGIVQHSYYHK